MERKLRNRTLLFDVYWFIQGILLIFFSSGLGHIPTILGCVLIVITIIKRISSEKSVKSMLTMIIVGYSFCCLGASILLYSFFKRAVFLIPVSVLDIIVSFIELSMITKSKP